MKFYTIRKKLLATTLCIALSISAISGCKHQKPGNDNVITTDINEVSAKFDVFLNELFLDEVTSDSITLNYSLAHPENYGIADYKATFGDTDLSKLDDTSEIVDTLKKLKEYDYGKLNKEQQFTYDILKRQLELNLEYSDLYLYEKVLSPTIGLQSQLPVVLAEYSFRTKKDIDDYIELINQSDEYFDYILAIVKRQSEAGLFMEDAVADKIIDQCNQFIEDTENNYMIEIFNDKVMAFDDLTDKERTAYMDANQKGIKEHLIPGYENMIKTLTKLKGTGKYTGGLCNYPEGSRYYEYLVKSEVGTDRTIAQLDKMLDQFINQGITSMSVIYMKNPDIFENFESYDFCVTEPHDILEDMRSRSQNDFPKLPELDYTIKYVHPSLEEHMSPAFYMIPALDEYDKNCIYINQKSMDEGQDLYSTLAHEGFPGHLLQNVYYLSTKPNPIRTQLNFSGYTEGWATYVEFQSYEMGAMDPDAGALNAANALITLCVYGKIDIGINEFGWDKTKTKEFIADYFGEIDEDVLDEIYYTMVAEPGNYLNYIGGALEFTKLRDICKQSLGEKYTALDFHTAVLNAGPCDFTTLRKYVQDALNIQDTTNSEETTFVGKKK